MSSASEQPPLLVGRIRHRLRLSSTSSNFAGRQHQSKPQCLRNTGFVFQCQEGQYLLIIPSQHLAAVSSAAQHQHAVQLTKYVVIATFDDGEDDEPDIDPSGNTTNGMLSILEVHRQGIKVIESQTTPGSQQGTAQSKVLSLSAFREAELDAIMAGQRLTGTISIQGIVETVSPVIAMIPSDPFALVEIVEKRHPDLDMVDDDIADHGHGDGDGCWCANEDENNNYNSNDGEHEHAHEHESDPLSCVVVIRGAEALSSLSAIQIGDRTTICNAAYRKWKVSATLAQDRRTKERNRTTSHRVPTRVVVVEKPGMISSCNANNCENERNNRDKHRIFGATRSHSHNDVYGMVTKVETQTTNSILCHRIVSVVHLSFEHDGSQHTATILLDGFPMSTALQIGLREGALVKASNLLRAPVNGLWFVANLRSSITIVEVASERDSMMTRSASVSHLYYVPFRYARIDASLPRRVVSEWTQGHHDAIAHIFENDRSGFEEAVLSFLRDGDDSDREGADAFCSRHEMSSSEDERKGSVEEQRPSPSTKRDPYEEFFFATSLNTMVNVGTLPKLVSISALRTAAQHAAIDEFRNNQSRLATSCTLSVQIPAELLSNPTTVGCVWCSQHGRIGEQPNPFFHVQ